MEMEILKELENLTDDELILLDKKIVEHLEYLTKNLIIETEGDDNE